MNGPSDENGNRVPYVLTSDEFRYLNPRNMSVLRVPRVTEQLVNVLDSGSGVVTVGGENPILSGTNVGTTLGDFWLTFDGLISVNNGSAFFDGTVQMLPDRWDFEVRSSDGPLERFKNWVGGHIPGQEFDVLGPAVRVNQSLYPNTQSNAVFSP